MKKITLILILLFSWSSCTAQDFNLKIHFIDVGEGESVLIESKDGCALIDTGNLLSGNKLTDYLKSNNVTTIKHLIITHHHLDHIMGVFFIMPKFNIENVYDNGINLNSSQDQILSYYEKALRSNKNYRVIKKGDVLKLGEAALEIIWPILTPVSGSFNHNSIVILLTYKDFRCLLTADIDKDAEAELLENGRNLNADVLKVAHHGAKDASSENFINKVNPRYAVISVDADNLRGYPHRNTLELLAKKHIPAFTTADCGTVIIKVEDKADIAISLEKPRRNFNLNRASFPY